MAQLSDAEKRKERYAWARGIDYAKQLGYSLFERVTVPWDPNEVEHVTLLTSNGKHRLTFHYAVQLHTWLKPQIEAAGLPRYKAYLWETGPRSETASEATSNGKTA